MKKMKPMWQYMRMTEKFGQAIKCVNCDGFGVVDAGYHDPQECPECNGSGLNWQYTGGAIAKYYGGPLNGRAEK